MELNEKQFIAGFNTGYLLAEYEPSLLDSITKNLPLVNSFILGLNRGQKEYQFFISTNKMNELKLIRTKNHDLNRKIK
jgi:hypothetical protein